ncbi:MAG: nucleotidyltransferase, partial [Verrucomicrobiales bacterium]|nr:nucleotidyltransferase [Verrucomicrobiales bacterium]
MTHPVHLILSSGTRVVTRNGVNKIGGGQEIVAGSVAVIVSSPDDAQHAYKIRFNDGAEAMVRRNEFSILKEFKNLPNAQETGNPISFSPGEKAGMRASVQSI